MERITLTQIEEAINYWRAHSPSQGEEARLCPQASALANPYALMIICHRHETTADELGPKALQAYRAWQAAVQAVTASKRS